jgi:hypothetical protein
VLSKKDMQTMENKNEKTTNRSMLTGMFSDRDSAENAYRVLRERGYSDDDVNLMMSDETRKKYFSDKDSELGNKAMEGAGKGSAIGGTWGAIIGAVAANRNQRAHTRPGLSDCRPSCSRTRSSRSGWCSRWSYRCFDRFQEFLKTVRRKYESGVKDGRIVMGVHPGLRKMLSILNGNGLSVKAKRCIVRFQQYWAWHMPCILCLGSQKVRDNRPLNSYVAVFSKAIKHTIMKIIIFLFCTTILFSCNSAQDTDHQKKNRIRYDDN